MEALYSPPRHAARPAAILYVLLVCIAIFGTGYIPTKIFVAGNVSTSSTNLIGNETLFRTGVLLHIVATIAIAVVVLFLYRLFRPVDSHISRMMVVPVLAQVSVVVLLEVFHIAALMILKGETLGSFTDSQRQELSYFLMRIHGFGIGVSQILWGLWLFPYGMLILRSDFMPRVFAALLVVNGIGYVAEGCAFILLERSDFVQIRTFTRATFIGLPLTMIWLLVKGIRSPKHFKISPLSRFVKTKEL